MKFADAKPGMIGLRFAVRDGAKILQQHLGSLGWVDVPLFEPAPEPKRVEGWVNVYEDCFSSVWKTQDAAGHDGADMGRIDFRHIAYIEGEGIVDITDQDDGIKYNRNDLQGGITEGEK